MKRLFRRLKHYLFPHAGNRYKPGVFAKESVAVVFLALFLIEGVYFFHTDIVLKRTGFLSAVLPAALTNLGNTDRVTIGASALEQDALLAEAAQKKAADMASKSYFSHVSPDGKTPWYWLDSVGYKYSYAGENLAVNFTDSMDVETAWMNSPAHHANIVKPQYTKVGIGTAQGIYEGQMTTFVVEFFATPAYATASLVPKKNPEGSPSASRKIVEATAPEVAPASKVLGAQAEKSIPANVVVAGPVSSAGVLAALASSPNHTIKYILIVFAAIVAVLFFLAIFVKIKVQYLEVVAGGVILLTLMLILLYFNGMSSSSVRLPSDGQTASVSIAF